MLPFRRILLRRGPLTGRAALFSPAFRTLGGVSREYASKPAKPAARNNTGPGFAMIFALAIIGTVIFNETAKNLDKNKPRNTFTEEEYEHVMQGLKRRVAMFPDGQLDVQFSLQKDSTQLKKLLGDSKLYIDPGQVVENYRSDREDPYEPLLNEVYSKYGPEYLKYLPQGLLVSLLGRYMKAHCRQGDHVVILDFPHSIKDAIKFENEVSSASKLLVPKESLDSDVCKYYQTVQKSQQL
ncbi:hypothetical protein ZYGR_0A03380 [Zygosaccharomyces rouxii]|uniref:Altered inheritance of mitochondria protein 36, mitochondrial n=2 Tax=Zygosaccharomyces rouxii TaxID=4956 RepID=AIM36_ZYGRC|nr:uncharacterized protein ZYRO0A07700g [Zygosaccharomyces rouxii]C5DQ08.1 RecName: Full=Altered inheritance of mitochondria protein 36, mitochondrial; AltName: Full=Found in mitochondria protein 39; Flags: Precursor [Zygosaccharomyces rouxii CBS 732]KAH9198710.1 altered inheritance of mitochondria protein 36, mitochondrial [Zygosaccharomyces rouxii]GAV46743.1 hypothetical protein ZYGR_0A03380 [Zygosaccharomyces rouxii]CAR25769.1 ZYRO0A07700p [Zygosaccharomyces rouxii]